MKTSTLVRFGFVIVMLTCSMSTVVRAGSGVFPPAVVWQMESTPECWASPDECAIVIWVRVPINGTCVTANSALWAQAQSFTATGQLYDSDSVICEGS